MPAIRHETGSFDEDDQMTVSIEVAQAQDDYWRHTHRRENYFRPGLDYEDYAPAYCVGYTGFAQYGGDFDEAEKSLLANWMRIKGDSRLGLDEARMAIHAAWDRAHAFAFSPQPAALQDPEVDAAAHLERLLSCAYAWLDRVFGPRSTPRAAPRVARRAQHGS